MIRPVCDLCRSRLSLIDLIICHQVLPFLQVIVEFIFILLLLRSGHGWPGLGREPVLECSPEFRPFNSIGVVRVKALKDLLKTIVLLAFVDVLR